jgi:hypothetical protein
MSCWEVEKRNLFRSSYIDVSASEPSRQLSVRSTPCSVHACAAQFVVKTVVRMPCSFNETGTAPARVTLASPALATATTFLAQGVEFVIAPDMISVSLVSRRVALGAHADP